MKIISHRGSKEHAAENTLAAISNAAKLKVAYIEFDIQYTKNDKIIVRHDTVSPKGSKVNDLTLKALLREDPDIIEIETALKACQKTPALIESKTKGTIARSLKYIKKVPTAAIASFLSDEILAARIHLPTHQTFLLQHYHPFGIIHKAKSIDAHGIGLNKFWLLTFPYYYHAAKKNKLTIYTYTVNSKFLAEWISMIFPDMLVCTDHPDSSAT